MIDSDEEVVNRYRYSPFGESRMKNEQVYNPYQYTGRRYDEESGLYYYRARMYSPEISRFLSNDPAQQGDNWYAYVGNDPTNNRDPSGEMSVRLMNMPLISPYTTGVNYMARLDEEILLSSPEVIRSIYYHTTINQAGIPFDLLPDVDEATEISAGPCCADPNGKNCGSRSQEEWCKIAFSRNRIRYAYYLYKSKGVIPPTPPPTLNPGSFTKSSSSTSIETTFYDPYGYWRFVG